MLNGNNGSSGRVSLTECNFGPVNSLVNCKGIELFQSVLRCPAKFVILKTPEIWFYMGGHEGEAKGVVLICGLDMAPSRGLWFNENH